MDSNQQQVLRYLATLERQLIKIYGSSYQAAIEIAEVRRAIESGGTFTWSGNKQAANRLEKILQQMTVKVETLIANGVAASYRQGEKSVEGDIIKALGVRSKAQKAEVTAICESATDSRRAAGQGAHAHLNARRGGIQASAQIWQQNAKKELEIIIQNGMKEGKSPSEIAQSIRPYLLEPNRYEKSVLNPETGRLERSDAAKKYHPGQGVYRSSYKNALRMARTEMTAAYREAEWESYQNNPLVKAYEIRLSGNHTTMKVVKGKRVPVPLTDICDKLAGVYPKTFKWTGWHPQCRCVMIPITVSKSEFGELLKARQEDRAAKREGKEASAVARLEQRAAQRQLPKQYTDWLAANQDRITAAKKAGRIMPMWITDNQTLANNTPIVQLPNTAPQQVTVITPSPVATPTQNTATDSPHKALLKSYSTDDEVNNTFKDINAGLSEKWFEHGNLDLHTETNPRNNGSTDLNGKLWLTAPIKADVKSALGKIGSGKSSTITEQEAKSMATFWHEITHNRHKQTVQWENMTPKARRYMELANEWVARNTLDDFYKTLGAAKNPHPQFITNRDNTGYNSMVVNYDRVIALFKLDKPKVLTAVKKGLFNDDYTTQAATLIEGLKQGGKIMKLDAKGKAKPATDAQIRKIVSKCEAFSSTQSLENWLKAEGYVIN